MPSCVSISSKAADAILESLHAKGIFTDEIVQVIMGYVRPQQSKRRVVHIDLTSIDDDIDSVSDPTALDVDADVNIDVDVIPSQPRNIVAEYIAYSESKGTPVPSLLVDLMMDFQQKNLHALSLPNGEVEFLQALHATLPDVDDDNIDAILYFDMFMEDMKSQLYKNEMNVDDVDIE